MVEKIILGKTPGRRERDRKKILRQEREEAQEGEGEKPPPGARKAKIQIIFLEKKIPEEQREKN